MKDMIPEMTYRGKCQKAISIISWTECCRSCIHTMILLTKFHKYVTAIFKPLSHVVRTVTYLVSMSINFPTMFCNIVIVSNIFKKKNQICHVKVKCYIFTSKLRFLVTSNKFYQFKMFNAI